MKYFMEFSYDGSNFYGYQKQKNKRTVQACIETALSILNRNHPVTICASGRTDAKVHALGQCAHFEFSYVIKDFTKALNSLLPEDIYVKHIRAISSSFHARFDVKDKEYCYKINIGEYIPMDRNYIFQYNRPLQIDQMKEALSYLEGEHNFKAFAKKNERKEDYTRTIYHAFLKQEQDMITIHFIGNGFFRYMVRNMVGTLIEIGEGKRVPSDINRILRSEDRKCAGKTVRPEGLYLVRVNYQ